MNRTAPRIDPAPLLVLGMHRSGTSCVAGMLQGCGFHAGEVSAWDPYNQRGNREDPEIVRLNDAVLQRHDAAWNDPPRTPLTLIGETLRGTRDAILASVAQHAQAWMFKDPRTLLTLPFWREALPNPFRIGVFRHPVRVALSLYFREPDTQGIGAGLALWLDYNRRLLAEYRRAPFPLLCFDLPRDEFVSRLDAALRSECAVLVERSLIDPGRAGEFYDAGLVHQQAVPPAEELFADDAARALYSEALGLHAELCAIAGVDPVHLALPTANALSPARWEPVEAAVREGRAGEALQLMRELLAFAPDPPSVWRRMIGVARDAGIDTAQLCREAVAACAGDAALRVELCEQLQRERLNEEALAAVDEAIRLRPDWWLPQLRRGACLSALERWHEAVASLQRARDMNARYHWTLLPLAIAQLRAGMREVAGETFAAALRDNPQERKCVMHHQWANALAETGDIERALAHHEQACAGIACKPYMVAGWAGMLLRHGQAGRALSVLDEAVARGLEGPALRSMRQRVMQRRAGA
ncbi:MAG: hypothetical protein CALGDGBN_00972 [Pseudomonadales bacterium]|nr:hypothetical protein [Pseudomonadales bacterium]